MPSKEFLESFQLLFADVAQQGIPKTGNASFGNYRSIQDLTGQLRGMLLKHKFYMVATIKDIFDVHRTEHKIYVKKYFSFYHYEYNGENDHISAYATGEGNIHPKNCFGEATAHTNAFKQFICDIFCLNSTEEMEVKVTVDVEKFIQNLVQATNLTALSFKINAFKEMVENNQITSEDEERIATEIKKVRDWIREKKAQE